MTESKSNERAVITGAESGLRRDRAQGLAAIEIKHRVIKVNGLQMRLAEAGSGPLVVLLHGFPESWYSWRHQLRALADAGFHAVAPNQRGYPGTDSPAAVMDYTILHLVGDVVGLIGALGEQNAAVIGHGLGRPGGLAHRAAAPGPGARRRRAQRAVHRADPGARPDRRARRLR
jgi:pimeloyl-ACP methyl ester carboxylesterase